MASTLIVLIAALAACQAGPIWFVDNGFAPGTVFIRQGRAPDFLEPSISYGYGSGFAADIGGIRTSHSFGNSFQTGGGQAYGAGIGRSDGNIFANGVGYASTNPQQVYRTNYPYAYSPYNAQRRDYTNNFGNVVSTAQSYGGSGATIAQSYNGPSGSRATSAVQNGATTAISHSDSSGNAIASTGDGNNSALAASHILGNGQSANTAQTHQLRGGAVQHSGATTYNYPGYQVAQSIANTY